MKLLQQTTHSLSTALWQFMLPIYFVNWLYLDFSAFWIQHIWLKPVIICISIFSLYIWSPHDRWDFVDHELLHTEPYGDTIDVNINNGIIKHEMFYVLWLKPVIICISIFSLYIWSPHDRWDFVDHELLHTEPYGDTIDVNINNGIIKHEMF